MPLDKDEGAVSCFPAPRVALAVVDECAEVVCDIEFDEVSDALVHDHL